MEGIPAAAEDALDTGLRLLAGRAPEYRGGLSDHGPMVADALVRLGQAPEVVAWVCRYSERLEEETEAFRASRERLETRLERDGWRATVADMVPLLMPGVLAGAFHAVIRVAHGVRMMAARDAPPRRRELAAGLAYWVERREPLGPVPSLGRGRTVATALASLPALPADESRWLIFERARAARDAPAFAEAIAGVDLPDEPVRALHALAAVGRDLFLSQPHAPIVYVHAITGPLAVSEVVPHLDRTSAQEAVAWTWQALAALHAAYRQTPVAVVDAPPATGWSARVTRAVADGDEHAIKLTLACRLAHARDGDPRWLVAADRLGRGRTP